MPYRNKAKMSLRVISVICFNLQHLPYCRRTDRSEDLVKVRQHRIACHSAITEHGVVGLFLGNSRNNLIGNVVVEASVQEALSNIKHFAAGNSGLLNLGRKKYTEVKHNLEQQVFRRSVLFYVVCIVVKQSLLHLVGLVEYLFHVGSVALQHTEADVKSLCGKSSFFFDFRTCTTDAFLANITNGFISWFYILLYTPQLFYQFLLATGQE